MYPETSDVAATPKMVEIWWANLFFVSQSLFHGVKGHIQYLEDVSLSFKRPLKNGQPTCFHNQMNWTENLI